VRSPSEEAKRLSQLFPDEGGFFSADTGSECFEFPVLQPGSFKGRSFDLKPWSKSSAAIVFEVRFSDLVNIIPGAEYVLGEVVVPLSDLVAEGSVNGWFRLTGPGSQTMARSGKEGRTDDDDSPQVHIDLRWISPNHLFGSSSAMEIEASSVVQEEMVKSAVMHQQQKISLFGSSIGAFNTVRGLSSNLQTVQNALGSLLDSAESAMNLFNFSDPWKSTVAFSAILLLWVILVTVPTRMLIFASGVGQFGSTLYERIRASKSHDIAPSGTKSTEDSPVATWLSNAFLGLPSDEDLRRSYFWDTQRIVALESSSRSSDKRNSRLANLWNAKWYGEIEIVKKVADKKLDRKPAFGLIQGHRVLWWGSVNEFDGGEAVSGQIFLQGHAGIATPSPMETYSLKGELLDRVVAVFGRGGSSQERMTLICASRDERLAFEEAVQSAIQEKAD